MRAIFKKKLQKIILVILLLSCSAGLVLFALRNSIDLYYTPSDIKIHELKAGAQFRLGGMVAEGSLHYATQGSRKYFKVTDFTHTIDVYYDGIFPDLFKEKQGVVIKGELTSTGEFAAAEVLAKHDEKYMPPKIIT